jgi:hypothetical protein
MFAFERRLESNLRLEEVRTLRQLEPVTAIVVVVPGSLSSQLARARVDLARHQERREVTNDAREWCGSVHQVVLVGSIGVALAIAVVLVDGDPVTWWECPVQLL